MKNLMPIREFLTRSAVAIALAGMVGLPSLAFAQEKGATRLLQGNPAPAARAADAVRPAGCCPMCKDSPASVVEKTGKASPPEVRRAMLRHECPGCETRIVTQGIGKQAKEVPQHVCTMTQPRDGCCSTASKSGTPAPAPSQGGHQH